jgi:hypothetical protein
MPSPRALGVFLFGLIGVSVAACSAASSSAAPAGPCERLVRCCDSLSGPSASQCRSTVETYQGQTGAADACTSALSGFEQSGACPSSGAAGGDGGAEGSDPGSSGRAICAAYIACVGSTTPEGLGVIAATYGPDGSCWAAVDESLCLKACRTGLRNVRAVSPDEKACPECLAQGDCTDSPGRPACDTSRGRCVACTTDAQCGGATPACDVTRNECVACTKPAHCKTGTCDSASRQCVRCNSDADCSAPAPRCRKSPGTESSCVACRTGADCSSGACDNGACCQPETCGELKASSGINPATWICGSAYSTRCGGTTINCGSCARGSCKNGGSIGRCSLEDTPCTPGAPGACLGDELCAYVPSKNGYVCSHNLRGETCVYGGDSYKCGNYHFSCVGANLVNNGKCRSHCLTQTDCAVGETCGFYPELGYGVCN